MTELQSADPQNQAGPRVGRAKVSASHPASGFGLIEVLVSLTVLLAGILAAGQMIYAALSSVSFSRSQDGAVIGARSQLQSLADQYSRDPQAPELSDGDHEGVQAEIFNPIDKSTLNLYAVSWSVAPAPDPRPDRILKSKYVTVTVTPIQSTGAINSKAGLNKIVSIAAILNPGLE